MASTQPTTIAGLGINLDALTKRVELLAKDFQYARARETLAPTLAALLANHTVTIPPVDPTTGMIDEAALEAALNTHPAGHPHGMPAERRAQLRRMLNDMGRL